MVDLEFFNGKEWVLTASWVNEDIAWMTLGEDNLNYRTVDQNGKVLTDKSEK